jgi:hypothetical protein
MALERMLVRAVLAFSVVSALLGCAGVLFKGRSSVLMATVQPADVDVKKVLKPWEDPDSEAAAFITGSPAVQPGLAVVNHGRRHAGAEAEAEEGTVAVEHASPQKARRTGSNGDERRRGVALYAKIQGAAEARKRVRRLQNIARQTRAILAKIAAADGVNAQSMRASSGMQHNHAWLKNSAAISTHVAGSGAGFARNTAPPKASHGEKLGSVYLENLHSTQPPRGHSAAEDGADNLQADDPTEDGTESEGVSVAGETGGATGGAALQRLRSAIRGPSGIAALGETADEAYGGDDGDDMGPTARENPYAGHWASGKDPRGMRALTHTKDLHAHERHLHVHARIQC